MYNITSLKEWGKKDAGLSVENGVIYDYCKALCTQPPSLTECKATVE